LASGIAILADQGWRRYQLDAIRAAIVAPLGRGYLDVGTGGGKTHIAAGLAFAGTGRWLYVTHGRSQVRQAEKAFASIGKTLDISIICRTWGKVTSDQLGKDMAGIIVDECHQCPAPSRAHILAQFRGGWRIGLSGTPLDRTDAKNYLVVGLLGPQLHQISVRELTAQGSLTPGKVVVVDI
jgi:superfamily II DNA or RNA helicase